MSGSTLQELLTEIHQTPDVETGVTVMANGIADRLEQAGNSPQALGPLLADLRAMAPEFAAAVTGVRETADTSGETIGGGAAATAGATGVLTAAGADTTTAG